MPKTKKPKITDRFIEIGDKLVKKISLLFIGEEEALCDACDKKKECARMQTIDGNVHLICKDCVKEIYDAF